MTHQEHAALIKNLENKVQAGPQKTDFQGPYFQACWVLIKQAGPAFKLTTYPNRVERQASWTRFQKNVDVLKAQQTKWEETSAALMASLLLQIEKACPVNASMAALMGDTLEEESLPEVSAEPKSGEETSASGASSTLIAVAPVAPELTLQEMSEACAQSLTTFMELKPSLTPANYKAVSDRLREVRQAIQKAWNELKRDNKARFAEFQTVGSEKNAAWRKKQERFRKHLSQQLTRDEDTLSREKDVLAGFLKTVASSADPVQLERVQKLASESQQNIATLEGELQELKATITHVDEQLAR